MGGDGGGHPPPWSRAAGTATTCSTRCSRADRNFRPGRTRWAGQMGRSRRLSFVWMSGAVSPPPDEDALKVWICSISSGSLPWEVRASRYLTVPACASGLERESRQFSHRSGSPRAASRWPATPVGAAPALLRGTSRCRPCWHGRDRSTAPACGDQQTAIVLPLWCRLRNFVRIATGLAASGRGGAVSGTAMQRHPGLKPRARW